MRLISAPELGQCAIFALWKHHKWHRYDVRKVLINFPPSLKSSPNSQFVQGRYIFLSDRYPAHDVCFQHTPFCKTSMIKFVKVIGETMGSCFFLAAILNSSIIVIARYKYMQNISLKHNIVKPKQNMLKPLTLIP